jgi:hypothetical protein
MRVIIVFIVAIVSAQSNAQNQAADYYHTVQINNKWYMVDPEGEYFHMRGCNHYGSGDHMPWNLKEKYGTRAEWRKSMRDRHKEWGFTYLPPSIGPNVRNPDLEPVLSKEEPQVVRKPEWSAEDFKELNYPFAAFLEVPKQYMAGEDLPDVFSAEFRLAVEKRCEEFVKPLNGNKYLIGYHFAHNPPWNINASSAEQWIRACTKPNSAGLKVWVQMMHRIYGSIERWRETYGTPIQEWSDIEELHDPLRGYVSGGRLRGDQESFLQLICEEWHKVYHNAIRNYDKNHLILGDRNTLHLQAPPSPWAYHIMSKYIDVLSVNVMGTEDIIYGVLEEATRNWNKPILLADTGAGIYQAEPPKSGFQARDLQEFEEAYSGLVKMSIEHPQIIGFGWCGWFETPNERGRSGVVSVVNDEPEEQKLNVMMKWNNYMHQHILRLNEGEN